MLEQTNSVFTRAILHALPTAIIALDPNSSIISANTSAAKLLGIPRNVLEGGPISRFVKPGTEFSTQTSKVAFITPEKNIELIVASRDIIVEDTTIKVLLLKRTSSRSENLLLEKITEISTTDIDAYEYVCKSLVELQVTESASIVTTTDGIKEFIYSTDANSEALTSHSIARTIFKDENTHTELLVIPDSTKGLTQNDLSIVDMFIALLKLRLSTQENATDASGSETALALALKAGDMGMCFFDTSKNECYLSDHLANWCGINPETFEGNLDSWIDTFEADDAKRIKTLFKELDEHNKFKTVVHVSTLEDNIRLELHGKPLTDSGSSEWVVIAKPYRDEQEVEAAWQTRISMEEAARIDAESELDKFESFLVESLIPTTSDVSIMHSRQDAGTWHIARPFGGNTHVFAVGAVSANNRQEAVVGAVLVATMADVLANKVDTVNELVDLIRDHARARDIETSISAVKVVGNKLYSASAGGASTYISGKSFTGKKTIETTTALNLSSHSEASPENIEVAANGRPWKILSTVVEVINLSEKTKNKEPNPRIESKLEPQPEETKVVEVPKNVSPFRSGSISPS